MAEYKKINIMYAYKTQSCETILIPLSGESKKEVQSNFENFLSNLSDKYQPVNRTKIAKIHYKNIISLDDLLKNLDSSVVDKIVPPLGWDGTD